MICADGSDHLHIPRSAYAGHLCTERLGDLYGECTDATRRTIDYTLSNFTKGERRYDLIFDAVGNHSFATCRQVLSPSGTYVAVGGQTDPWLIGPLISSIQALVLSWFVSQKLSMFIAKASKDDLILMQELMEAGKVRPVIDRCYGLREAPEAMRYLEEGHARGKVAITV